jgi:hypothetical protein
MMMMMMIMMIMMIMMMMIIIIIDTIKIYMTIDTGRRKTTWRLG